MQSSVTLSLSEYHDLLSVNKEIAEMIRNGKAFHINYSSGMRRFDLITPDKAMNEMKELLEGDIKRLTQKLLKSEEERKIAIAKANLHQQMYIAKSEQLFRLANRSLWERIKWAFSPLKNR